MVGFFSFQSLDQVVGVNGRMHYRPVLKEPHEETAPWGGCLEEEWSWGECFVGRGSAEAREGEGQCSHSE